MSKQKSMMDHVREAQNAKALEMAAKGVPLVHVPGPVSNETLEQEQRRDLEYMSRERGGLLMPQHKAAIRQMLKALTEAERKARAFDWLAKYGRRVYQSSDGLWFVFDDENGDLGRGGTPIEAVEDAIAKEAKWL